MHAENSVNSSVNFLNEEFNFIKYMYFFLHNRRTQCHYTQVVKDFKWVYRHEYFTRSPYLVVRRDQCFSVNCTSMNNLHLKDEGISALTSFLQSD